ncbi:hypothetical protein FACS1894103_2160 [Campylobacterota bacterium]|nr:hypothetical protein FACS1894103_2160 [Campylobacterota bacterium]
MNRQAEMVFWDVQHGHSTYIKTPNGRHIIIDLGTGNYSERDQDFSPLKHLKHQCGVQQLDYVVITHPHLDHIEDILNFDLLSPKALHLPIQLTNTEVMEGVQYKDLAKFKKYCEINDRYNRTIGEDSMDNTSNPNNWGGLKIQTFAPQNCSHDNFNNHSIITVFEYAGIKVVIPGDNEKASFDELFHRYSNSFKNAIKDAYVLLAPHHGRESGYHDDFIKLVNPRITIISDSSKKDTSATADYSRIGRGWKVFSRCDNASQQRKTLSTYNDGVISIKIGYDNTNRLFLNITKK